jgi:hypothetical protein
MSDIKALHEAATPAPWFLRDFDGERQIRTDGPDDYSVTFDEERDTGKPWYFDGSVADRVALKSTSTGYGGETDIEAADATLALIVALRNAYADGTLVERTPVGGERMSEDVALVRSVMYDRCEYTEDGHAAFDRILTSIERKPLDDAEMAALHADRRE